jgi:hypothetical protein
VDLPKDGPSQIGPDVVWSLALYIEAWNLKHSQNDWDNILTPRSSSHAKQQHLTNHNASTYIKSEKGVIHGFHRRYVFSSPVN